MKTGWINKEKRWGDKYKKEKQIHVNSIKLFIGSNALDFVDEIDKGQKC